jgi:septal ring factor EnvC (AmiA/AmiB activator)
MLKFAHLVSTRLWPLASWLPAALVVFGGIGVLSAQTSDRARTESQAQRASDRLQALQREADGLASEERSLLVDLRKLEIARDVKTEQLKQIDADTDHVARELGTIGNQIDALESQDSAARPVLEARMVQLYKLGSAGYVRLLLNVADLKEFGRAYRMVSALAALDRARVIQHQRNLDQLRAARSALERRRSEMAALRQSATQARAAAERAAAERSRLVAQIDTRRDLTAQLAGELQSAQQRLQQTLGAISSGAPRAEADAASLPIRPFRGALDWPVAGRVLTRFGGQAGRVSTTSMQNGIQILVQEGSNVRAVHDGVVAFAGSFTGYGNLVIVDHASNTYSLYGQLDAVNVSKGAKVDRGQAIGTTGRVLVGIPGMYFEMRVDGKAVDPLEWLKKQP